MLHEIRKAHDLPELVSSNILGHQNHLFLVPLTSPASTLELKKSRNTSSTHIPMQHSRIRIYSNKPNNDIIVLCLLLMPRLLRHLMWKCIKFSTFSFLMDYDVHLCMLLPLSLHHFLNHTCIVQTCSFSYCLIEHFNGRVYFMLVRVLVVSDSLFYHICFLIESSWKQLSLCFFVLIRVGIGVDYKL